MATRCISAEERFWSWVDRRGDDECWNWTGALDSYGYPRSWDGKRVQTGSRLAWVLTNGPIPAGLCVCHSCDNRSCCNPRHLWLGSHADNMRDMFRKGRARPGGGGGGRNREFCKRGHPQTPENLVRNGKCGTICRACRKLRQQEKSA